MDTIRYSGSQSWGCLLKDDSINTLGKTQDKTLMFAHQLFSPGPPRVSRLYYTIICSSQLFGKKSQIWLFFPVGLSIQSNLVLPKSENRNTGNIFQAMTLSIHLSKRQRQPTERVNLPKHIFYFSWNESQNIGCPACFRFNTSYSNRKVIQMMSVCSHHTNYTDVKFYTLISGWKHPKIPLKVKGWG